MEDSGHSDILDKLLESRRGETYNQRDFPFCWECRKSEIPARRKFPLQKKEEDETNVEAGNDPLPTFSSIKKCVLV